MNSKHSPEEIRKKVIHFLDVKAGHISCPICKLDNFGVVEKFHIRSLQESDDGVKLGGTSLPVLSIVCMNCGYIMDFASKIILEEIDENAKKD